MRSKVFNPWSNINLSNSLKIASCDASINLSGYSQLDLTCSPDPFSGNPDSKVYCLNMNPGDPGNIGRQFDKDSRYLKLVQKNLNHDVDSCFWTNGLIINGQRHPGLNWLERVMSPMKKQFGAYPKVFFVEYFPYHSKQGFNFPPLPSDEYRNFLVKKAMDDGKLIIVMRMAKKGQKGWFDIPELSGLPDYEKLIILKNPRTVWISPGNFNKPLSEQEVKYYFY